MPRLFTGLAIPPEISEQLSFLRGGLPGARWVDPVDYHLTLRFIGDIDDALANDVYEHLSFVESGPVDVICESACNFDPLSRGIGVQN